MSSEGSSPAPRSEQSSVASPPFSHPPIVSPSLTEDALLMGSSPNVEQSFHIGSPGRGPPELGRMLYHDGDIIRSTGMSHGLSGACLCVLRAYAHTPICSAT
jgi:hypothetical protein